MSTASRLRVFPAAVLAFGLTVGTITAAAAPAPPARAVEESSAVDPVSLVVAPQDPVLRPDTSEVQVDIVIRNPGEEALSAGTIELRLGSETVATGTSLDSALPLGAPLIAEEHVGATAAEDEQSLTISVPRADTRLSPNTPFGVHLLEARFVPEQDESPAAAEAEGDGLTTEGETSQAENADTAEDPDPTGALTGSTSLVVRGSGDYKVGLGLIIPLVLPSEIHTAPTRSQLEELTPGWDRLLTAARSQRATLAIDPRLIAGIRAYGEAAPENSRELLDRMERLDLPSFLLQYADADPAAQAALGYSKLLSPTSLDFVTRFGEFPPATPEAEVPPNAGEIPGSQDEAASSAGEDASGDTTVDSRAQSTDPDPAAGVTPTPTPTPTPTKDPSPVVPSLPELLAWPGAAAMAWPAEGAVDAATLELLARNGISSVVLDSKNTTLRGGPRATLPQGTAIVSDAELATAAKAALAGKTAADRHAASARLASSLALAARDGGVHLALALDRGAVSDSEDSAALLDQIAGFDWVTATPLGELQEGQAELRAGDTLEDRRELLRTAAGRESAVNQIGAVLVRPVYLSGYQRTRLLELFATRYAAPSADFAEVAAAYRTRDAELLEGVQAVSTEHTQLVGASTRVPVQLHNSLPFDARVHVRVDPASAALSIAERNFSDILVPAEANQRILVPVHSRISSGESGLVLSVSAPSGDPTVFTGTLSISISSSVETIGMWVLGVLAALLLGFGIWRSVRRGRAVTGGPDHESGAPITGPAATDSDATQEEPSPQE